MYLHHTRHVSGNLSYYWVFLEILTSKMRSKSCTIIAIPDVGLITYICVCFTQILWSSSMAVRLCLMWLCRQISVHQSAISARCSGSHMFLRQVRNFIRWENSEVMYLREPQTFYLSTELALFVQFKSPNFITWDVAFDIILHYFLPFSSLRFWGFVETCWLGSSSLFRLLLELVGSFMSCELFWFNVKVSSINWIEYFLGGISFLEVWLTGDYT